MAKHLKISFFLRRGFQCSQLKKVKIRLVPGLYSSVRYSQNCETVRFELDSLYRIEDVACKIDFPSSNPVDVNSITRVKSLIDDATLDLVLRPTKDNQAGYHFFFILKEFALSS